MLPLIVGAFVLALVIAGIALRPKKARFAFEEHEDYVVLEIRHRLWADDEGLVTMSYLREALRLKLVSDYRRLMIKARELTVADDSAFWLLVGGLGPVLLSETMNTAVVCRPKGPLGRRLRDSVIAECFPSEAKALEHLRSEHPPRLITLDKEWVEALLVSRKRPPAKAMKRAA